MDWLNRLAPAEMCFCEESLSTFPVHPADTWTNISPIVAGFLIMWQARKHESSFSVLGVASIFTGLCSAFFHATNTFLGEMLDLCGMFAVIISCLLIQMAHSRYMITHRLVVGGTILLTAVATTFAYFFIWLATPLFGLFVIGVVAFEIADDRVKHYRNLIRASLALLVAFGFWVGDYQGWLCNPQNHILTGHGMWHLLNGLVFFYIYRQLVTNRSGAA